MGADRHERLGGADAGVGGDGACQWLDRERDDARGRYPRRRGHRGSIVGSTGTLRPGSGLGVLHGKSVAIGAGVTVAIGIKGSDEATDYSQLDVTGSVNLGQASLALTVNNGFVPAAGFGELVIVANDGADPIIGTFSGLPEGAAVNAGNGKTFHITYAGGTGNDVALITAGAGTYYLSEGATGGFFDLDVLIANPNATDAPVTLTFLREDGGDRHGAAHGAGDAAHHGARGRHRGRGRHVRVDGRHVRQRIYP